jgi:hypothetical protein
MTVTGPSRWSLALASYLFQRAVTVRIDPGVVDEQGRDPLAEAGSLT